MKSKRLKIKINKPVSEVFAFTLNPDNTPLWVGSIVKEEVNEKPAKLGTTYRNVSKDGKWSEYKVTSFERNKSFVFTLKDNNYSVRYTFSPVSNNSTELEYYEWVKSGDLEEPFSQDNLLKLKSVLEK